MGAVVALIADIIISILTAFASGWAFMIAVGIAHAEWLTHMPTIGYGPAILIMVFLGFTANMINVKVKVSSD